METTKEKKGTLNKDRNKHKMNGADNKKIILSNGH